MKHLVALFALFFAVAAFADDIPAVSARQALDAAEKSMHDRGLDKQVYVESVALTHATLLGGETYWVVKYSHPILLDGENKQEVGIKIRLDGSVTRLVKGFGKN